MKSRASDFLGFAGAMAGVSTLSIIARALGRVRCLVKGKATPMQMILIALAMAAGPYGVIKSAAIQPDVRYRMVSIDRVPFPERGTPFFMFSKDRVQVYAGCNRMGASARKILDGLQIGPMLSTRMGCPMPVSLFERKLGETLFGPVKFRAGADGGVIIVGRNQSTILLEPMTK